jgi:hypothetical protein
MDAAYLFTLCGPHPVCLWLHTDKDPPDDLWRRAMGETEEALQRAASLGGEVKALVVSDGGAPTLRQRSRLTQIYDYRPYKLSVVTTVMSNPVKRGIAMAMRWFNPSLSMYQPQEMTAALAHLGLTEHWPQIKALYQQLQDQLPLVRALDIAIHAVG